MKSTVDEIRQRFDSEVDRFSNLETGQVATVDAPLAMALVAQAAAATTPQARHVFDVGCGAGNYTLKLLERLPNLDVTLIDLSQPMLDRASQRISKATTGTVAAIQDDIRNVALTAGQFDVILASQVLHHLREDQDWKDVFAMFHRALRSGGSLWIFDLVESPIPAVESIMKTRYGDYLTQLKDESYRVHVFAYVEKEGTLEKVRATIRRAAPDATETISYQMAAFKLHGILVYFAAWTKHIGLYPPISGDKALEKAIACYAGPKGNLQFPLDEPIPYDLIERIVKLRVKQDEAKAAAKRTKRK